MAPGVKTLRDAQLLELGDVGVGDDAAAEDDDVARVALGEQLDDPREQRHVRAGEDRQPDGVGVLLDRRLDDLLRRLVQAGVDDLHAGVAQRPGDDLGAAVVPVEARLGDDDPDDVGRRGHPAAHVARGLVSRTATASAPALAHARHSSQPRRRDAR